MNELALFAGAGGGILAGHLLGWRTVAAVEIEDYPRRVLLQRQADGFLPRFPIWDDICTFDGKPWRGKIDVISGGFPCQDLSAAGKGKGLDGERSGLWREMARVICEVQPRYAFIENSPMLTVRGLDRVLCDLAQMGFDAQWGVLGAADVGANHQRDRIWIKSKRNDTPPPPPHIYIWTTPTAHMSKETNAPSEHRRNTPTLTAQVNQRWPTPTVCGNYNRKGASATSGEGLATAVQKWPTPDASAHKYRLSGNSQQSNSLMALAGGKLNPDWTEWLMGWPPGWTDLKPLEMDKLPSALQPHGDS